MYNTDGSSIQRYELVAFAYNLISKSRYINVRELEIIVVDTSLIMDSNRQL